MKKFLTALAVFLSLNNPAQALWGFCSYGANGCEPYTNGLTQILTMTPVFIDVGGVHQSGFAESDYHALGMSEYYVVTGGNYDGSSAAPPNAMTVNAIKSLKTLIDGKFTIPTGTTSQYVRGDGSLATLPTPSKTFNYPSRTLNTCFQISSTKDADFHYSVDVTAALVLGGGTATFTSYTNSGCTTGAQLVRDGTVSGVIAGGTTSVNLDGSLPANRWGKITTSTSGLGATVAIRAAQQEVLH